MGHYLASLISHFDASDFGQAAKKRRLTRHRQIPDAESLETRTCLSTVAASVASHQANQLEFAARPAVKVHKAPVVVHHATQVAHLAKAKQLQVIYVKPGAKPRLNAGKTAARPLGNLNKAISMIKPGGTIILAPGVYNQNVVLSLKSNITIVGAANQSSIIAPSGGDGIKVALSDNITINNVWLRSSQGRGMAIMGSSVTLNNIKTDGTRDDGVVATGYQGRTATLNANSSQFNAIQTGDGLHLQGGSSATIVNSTFNGVGTAANVSQASNGLVLAGDATANITSSQFIGNTNGGLVALENSHVTAQYSTFASNVHGNGALFLDSSTADLRFNSFSTNGVVAGPATGLNGLEFINGFTGTGFVSGNSFLSNTGNGIYIGGGPNTIQILSNVFDNNFVGITMDSASGSTINAVVQANLIRIPVGASSNDVGILAVGRGLTATIGGDGGLSNSIENYANGTFIYEAAGDGNNLAGAPNLRILTNGYTSNGRPVSPQIAIHTV